LSRYIQTALTSLLLILSNCNSDTVILILIFTLWSSRVSYAALHSLNCTCIFFQTYLQYRHLNVHATELVQSESCKGDSTLDTFLSCVSHFAV